MNARVNSRGGSAQEQAAAWHARLASETSTETDWLAFEHWLQDSAHRAAYEALENQLEVVRANPNAFGDLARRRETRPPRLNPVAVRFAVLAAAAAAAAIFLLATTADHAEQFAYASPASATRAVTLPDSSIVDLNRGASIRGEWRRGSRRIVLERGEAAFRVAHDDARPFEVVAGDVTLRDVGTEFNVLRTDGAIVVSVRDGAVELRQGHLPATVVAAGFQARVENGQAAIAAISGAEDAFAWRTGRLVYHDAPLSAVLADISRYGAKPVVPADARTSALRFSGVLIIDDSQPMLRRLESFLPIQSEQDAERVVVRSRR